MPARLFLPLLIAIGALIFFPNFSAVPKHFERLAMPDLMHVLRWGGMSPNSYLGEDGDLRIDIDLAGHAGQLIARGCGSTACGSIDLLQARSRIEIPAGDYANRRQLLAHLNEFNASHPLARAYLDDDDAVLALELRTADGVSSTRLGAFLGSVTELRQAFGRHMAAYIGIPPAPARPALPTAPVTIATAPAPARPARPPIPDEPLSIRVSEMRNIGDGCRIRGHIEGAGTDATELRVIVPSRNERFDFLVIDADQPLPDVNLGPVREMPCRELERIVLERIAVCGRAAPFGEDCPTAGLIVGDTDLSPVVLVRVR
ncbi:MAG: YbjN domain-containing protein [Gammaproteobacteria bacterium]|nr:YbjN domain-containing protein [Gammaproteobacteria bacterium]